MNNSPIQISALLRTEVHTRYEYQRSASSSAEQGGMKAVYSHPFSASKGDIALTYGLEALQVNSQVGKSHGGISEACQSFNKLGSLRIADGTSLSSTAVKCSSQRLRAIVVFVATECL